MINIRFYTHTHQFIDSFSAQAITLHYSLNAINTFDFDIKVSNLRAGEINRLQRMLVHVDVDGVETMVGSVDTISVTRTNDFRFQCNSQMFELTQIRAKSNALYQNQQVVAILLDLLSYAPEWSLGSVVSMQDFQVRTTIDLRGEKRLFSQIVTLIESTPNLFFREGANKTLDIGTFAQNSYPLIPTDAVQDLTVETKYMDLLYQLEAYGGEVSLSDDATRKSVTLDDALVFAPSLATHPSFPIVVDKGVSVVRNVRDSNVFEIGDRVEFYSEIKPERTDPSPIEIAQAGYALWLKSVKELEENSSFKEKWDCSTTFLPDGFKVGDRVFIHAAYNRIYYDYTSGSVGLIHEGSAADWFRVSEYDKIIGDSGTSYNLSVSKGLQILRRNPVLDLYEMASNDLDPELTSNPISLRQYELVTSVIPLGQRADCYNLADDGSIMEGRTLTIPLTNVPLSATGVSVVKEPFSNQEGVVVRLVTSPTLDESAQVCVSYLGGWRTFYTFPIYLLVEYT